MNMKYTLIIANIVLMFSVSLNAMNRKPTNTPTTKQTIIKEKKDPEKPKEALSKKESKKNTPRAIINKQISPEKFSIKDFHIVFDEKVDNNYRDNFVRFIKKRAIQANKSCPKRRLDYVGDLQYTPFQFNRIPCLQLGRLVKNPTIGPGFIIKSKMNRQELEKFLDQANQVFRPDFRY